ncbi:MAG: hypothetical protein P1V36_00445 [Planctomycetota bacterium]|nr:hypothetical protein [Planctomycetota bacterium]
MTTTERLTLPGDIPGALRAQTPAVVVEYGGALNHPAKGKNVTVLAVQAAPKDQPWGVKKGDLWALVAWWRGDLGDAARSCWVPVEWIALAQPDPTGAAHMAWWLGNRPMERVRSAVDALGIHAVDYEDAMDACVSPVDGKPDIGRIDILRRVVLHVAGREVPA